MNNNQNGLKIFDIIFSDRIATELIDDVCFDFCRMSMMDVKSLVVF